MRSTVPVQAPQADPLSRTHPCAGSRISSEISEHVETTLSHRETKLYDEERGSQLASAAARPEDVVAGALLAVGWDTPSSAEEPRTQIVFLLLDPTPQRPVRVRADQLA